MSGVNKVILVGNVGTEPVIRPMKNGENVANFTLATSEDWKDKASGEKKSITHWHRVVCYGAYSKVIETHIKKGMKIYVEGKLSYTKYNDKNGVEKYNTDIIIKDFQFLSAGNGAANLNHDREEPNGNTGGQDNSEYVFDDDIPF